MSILGRILGRRIIVDEPQDEETTLEVLVIRNRRTDCTRTIPTARGDTIPISKDEDIDWQSSYNALLRKVEKLRS